MKTQNSLRKKMAGYSVFASALLASGAVHAQVYIIDVIPDDSLYFPGNYQELLDFNNDGISDCYVGCGLSTALFRNEVGNSFDVMGTMPNYISVSQLACGDTISPSKEWHTVEYIYDGIILGGGGSYGKWQGGVVDGYAGLRVREGTDTTYGWIRMAVAPDASYLIIKEYAYSSIPNVAITVCDGIPLAVNEQPANNLQVHPNPAGSKTLITCPDDMMGATLNVYDVTGRKFISMKISAIQTQLDVSELPQGIFTVSVRNDKAIWTKKLQVIH